MKGFNRIRLACLAAAMAVLLVACKQDPFKPMEGDTPDNIMESALENDLKTNAKLHRQAVPEAVTDALLPSLKIGSSPILAKDQRFDVSVNNVDAKTFFMGLVEGTNYNMFIGPDVKGNITMNLKNVNIDAALQAAHDVYGYDYLETQYGYHISAPGLSSHMFTLNYPDIKRKSESQILVSSGQITQDFNPNATPPGSPLLGSPTTPMQPTNVATPAAKIETKTESDFWTELAVSLQVFIKGKEGRQIVINPQAGLLIVTANNKELEQIADYLDALQKTMVRQVILEAKILEVALNDSFQAGIDWKLLGVSQNGTQALTIPDSIEASEMLDNFTQIFTLKATGGSQFNIMIDLLTTQGNVQVLSSPHIATLNHQKAVIKVGYDEFYVTDVTTINTPNGVSGNQLTQDVQLTPFFSGIALDVTPQINSDGNVILHIHPIVSRVSDKEKTIIITGGNQILPTALSVIRESDSIVEAKNGQVIVIGGLMEESLDEEIGATPGLRKIPFLGSLFRKTEQISHKTELVILLKATYVDNNQWAQSMKASLAHIKKLNRGSHFGDLYQEIGNMAEFPELQRDLEGQTVVEE
ncbi:MAG: pilus (MSHA type) biogenesis protein MshL [Gammaproteobacteria bacterium]